MTGSRVWLRRGVAVLLLAALAALALWRGPADTPQVRPRQLALLIPDELASDDVQVQVWEDAAAELGFELSVVRASALLRAGGAPLDAALILPDTLHRRMNDALIAAVDRQVRAGAKLMLVYDAGVNDLDGRYHPVASRLSTLAGVHYAMYGTLGPRMAGEAVAWVDGAALPALRLPPGKLVRKGSHDPYTSLQPQAAADEALAVVGYHYGALKYPSFQTQGHYAGQRLMHADDGSLLAGLHTIDRGQVLFVNLPLTYLKLRTDGLLLHAMLRYFAQDVAVLPQLSTVPDGRGALVMNWHVDSGAAVPAIEALEASGAFTQGPYSFHLTAGPDVDLFGDGMGMDLPNNPQMRALVRRLVERGDEIGSHGGWIHNAFGAVVDRHDTGQSITLIEQNVAAVRDASGQLVREYSAPMGNHPAWVTPWLHANGIRAYYFTGDIGMPPTRSYQDGRRSLPDMWAFPVLSYGAEASFEEKYMSGQSQEQVGAWLRDVADYCADNRTVRLVYFHPPGIAFYADAFRKWLAHTRTLGEAGRLRWITMAAYAEFSNARLQVQWQLQPGADAGAETLQASHPRSLAHYAWMLPVRRYAEPRVLEGQASVVRAGDYWQVVAGAAPQLRLQLPLLPHAPSPTLHPGAPL